MNRHTTLSPARRFPPVPCAQTAGVVAAPVAAPAIAFDLPLWANNEYARDLIAKIIVERPERTRVIAETMCGPVLYGYAGRTATKLRAVYQVFENDRLDWVAECAFDSPEWRKRRDALIAYGRDHGPDALIARVLEAAHG